MNQSNVLHFRQKFIGLAEDIFRQLGFPPPEMFHDDKLPLAMELNYADRDFEILHSSTEMPERLLVTCFLGQLPEENTLVGIQRLLEANLSLARTHEAIFCIREDDIKICCMCFEDIESMNANKILERMKQISKDSYSWYENSFSSRGFRIEPNLISDRTDLV